MKQLTKDTSNKIAMVSWSPCYVCQLMYLPR